MSILLTNEELNKLTTKEKIRYFDNLKNISKYVFNLRENKDSLGRKAIKKIYPGMRCFDYKIMGEENIPSNGVCLFACNHSNSHDILTAVEIFDNLGLNVSPLIANDDLNILTKKLFASCDGVLFDRRKDEGEYAILQISSRLINNQPCLIFPEATWNIHPYKPMHDIRWGVTQIGAITKVPIIPVIFEYVEVPEICSKENELYTTCIIKFGEPIYIDYSKDLFTQTDSIKQALEEMRLENWKGLNIKKENWNEKDIMTYLNHTYLKKFKSFGFTYASDTESKYILSKNGLPVENEYCLRGGLFMPGVTNSQEGKKYIMKR